MKKVFYILFVVLVSMTGCEDFLDVDQKGKVTEDELFQDIAGYRSAMYGVYASLAKENLYGRVLSYGFVDELAQLYYNPKESTTDNLNDVLAYKYKNQNVVETVDGIWGGMYEAIAYVNNILAHLQCENKDAHIDFSFMEGECYGLRAFLHFDIVRLFADNIILKESAGGIPYSYDYDLQNKRVYSLKESYANILSDLNRAEEILSVCELDQDVEGKTPYLSQRYLHMNIAAVYAVKARVYLSMGDYARAREYAEKVIANSKYKLIQNPSEQLDKVKKFPGGSELIWGLFNNSLYDAVYRSFVSLDAISGCRRVRLDLTGIYETNTYTPTSTDYRYQKFFKAGAPALFIRFLEKEAGEDDDITKMVQGVNLIRLPEMYYIAAEGWYNENPELAISYLNAVRNSRGLADLAAEQVASKDGFMAELQKERIKELWGEGQIFLDYKRNNAGFLSSDLYTEIAPSAAVFNLPWPEAELEYGSSFKN